MILNETPASVGRTEVIEYSFHRKIRREGLNIDRAY